MTDDRRRTWSLEVGCAFTIPSLKIQKLYKLNNGISIFSAELFAIHMALTHVLDSAITAHDIAILSDSKSALQALQNTSHNRQDIILECRMAMHQLISRGTNVTLVWIPSHSGIRGNDDVDRAAKMATALPHVTNDIGYTVSEIKSRLNRASHTLQKNRMNHLGREKKYFDSNWYPDGVSPKVPPHLSPLFYRLRTQSLRFNYINQKCCCSSALTFDHLFQCSELIPKFTKLSRYNVSATPGALLCRHPTFGWQVAVDFVKELSASNVGSYL